MKTVKPIFVSAVAFVVVLGISLSLAVQAHPQNARKFRYKIKDLGTLGGSYAKAGGISNAGWVEGYSLLPGDSDVHEFLWHEGDGALTDLGTLGGLNSFSEYRPNDRGNAGGESETSTPDPNGEDFCGFGTQLICLAFFWQNNVMTAQTTLGGNNGAGFGTNDWGELAGTAENTTVEPTCAAAGTGEFLQYRPVIWRNGRIHELLTFPGDPVGVAYAVNNRGQAVGQSGPCGVERLGTTSHALLWQDEKPTDLGNLGGAMNNLSQDINDRGQVVGLSDLAGDAVFHAFLWHRNVMTDLGTLPGDIYSNGESINIEGEVVGASADANFNGSAFVWRNGVMTDLNTLIPANSPLFLRNATSNNDRGQIVGGAVVTATGETHVFLATPIEDDEAGESATTATADARLRRPSVILPERIRRLEQGHRRSMSR
jgi:probable HAF family extracellular repeat protein